MLKFDRNAQAGGINFYSTLVFGNPITVTMVESNLMTAGFASNAYRKCLSLRCDHFACVPII